MNILPQIHSYFWDKYIKPLETNTKTFSGGTGEWCGSCWSLRQVFRALANLRVTCLYSEKLSQTGLSFIWRNWRKQRCFVSSFTVIVQQSMVGSDVMSSIPIHFPRHRESPLFSSAVLFSSVLFRDNVFSSLSFGRSLSSGAFLPCV